MIEGLWGTSAKDVWGVGNGVFHWDGHAWSRVPVHLWGRLDAVWGTGPADVWVQGYNMLLHFDGCWWTTELAARRGYRSHGGVVMADGEIMTPFARGTLRGRGAGDWKFDRGPPGVRLTAIRGSAASGVWASGHQDDGVLLALDRAGRWNPVPLPSGSKGPKQLHVQAADAVYITDEDGAVHRWDRATWHDERQDLSRHGSSALWVSPGGDVWLTTNYGGLLGKRAEERMVSAPPPAAAPGPRTCGPDPTAVALASALTVEDVHRPDAAPMTDAAAREVARVWLEGMRDTQALTLAQSTALPLAIDGFERCGVPRVARDVEGFRDLLDCILDLPLVHYVPEDARGGWERGASGGVVGTLKVIRPAGLARALARYRGTVAELARAGQLLVQARMTDNNGVTNHAVLAVRATASGPRVATVLYDTHFEH